ncbi:MAG: hypothetical protein GY756_04655, partial [bacterium]|nr:hypothetical protein [bacterium]
MTKFIWILIFLTGLISCKNNQQQNDFYGKTIPSSIPLVFELDLISIKGRLEQGFSISPDLNEIHFGVIGNHDTLNYILVTRKKNNTWTTPKKPEYIGNDSVFFPMYAPDGKTLTFTKRHSTSMQTDLWYCEKNNGKWSESKRYSDNINSIYREGSSCLSIDNTLYFTTNRDTAFGCCGDIYYSDIKNSLYDKAKIVDNVNSNFDEEGVYISPNEDYLIIQSWKTDYDTKHDLYISYRRKDGSWTQVLRLDSLINSIDLEQRPFVTYDNSYLFFNRFKLDSQFKPVESDIYWVGTQKIFKPFVYNPLDDIIANVGEIIEITIPNDYFKDIDDKHIKFSV